MKITEKLQPALDASQLMARLAKIIRFEPAFIRAMQVVEELEKEFPAAITTLPVQKPSEKNLHKYAPAAYDRLDRPRIGFIKTVVENLPDCLVPAGQKRSRYLIKNMPRIARYIDEAAVRAAYAKDELGRISFQPKITLADIAHTGSKRLQSAIAIGPYAHIDLARLSDNKLEEFKVQNALATATVVEVVVLKVLAQDTGGFKAYAPVIDRVSPSGSAPAPNP